MVDGDSRSVCVYGKLTPTRQWMVGGGNYSGWEIATIVDLMVLAICVNCSKF